MKWIILFLMLVTITNCAVRPRPGPPPHAPAHGYHKKYVYYYYPDLEIYLLRDSKSYAVLRGGTWVIVKTRPAILTPSHSYVIIEVESKKPWLNHSYYKKIYPPGKGKKRSGGKGKGKK